jgi:MFS family permease
VKTSLCAVAASLYLAEYTLYSNSSATVLLNSSISDYFHVPYGVAANVGVAFLAGFCITLLPAGMLQHRCRPVTTFYVSSVALALLGVAASLSPEFWALIVIRFAQGIASAMLAPQLFRIARQQFYPDRHAAFLGTWGLVVSASALCSPLLTAALNDAWGWRAFPYETVVTTLLSIALLARGATGRPGLTEPTVAQGSSHLATTSVIGVGLAQVGIFLAVGATDHITVKVALCALAAVLGVGVVAVCRQAAPDGTHHPILYRGFVIVFVAGIATNVFTLVTIYYLQRVRDFGSYGSALFLVPMAFLAGLLPMTRLARPRGNAENLRSVAIGAAFLTVGGVSVAASANQVAPLLISSALMGCAMGFLWSSLAAIVLTNSSRIPFDSAVYHFLRALGAAIGVSIGATAAESIGSGVTLLPIAAAVVAVAGVVGLVSARAGFGSAVHVRRAVDR